MKILLIGATGQIGYALVHALAKTGHEITALVRAVGNLSFPESITVVVEPNFTGAVFERLLPEADCAIYGVGLPEQFAFDKQIFERVNLKLLQTFLVAMGKSGLRRLVYISTYEVFAAQNGVIRESHPTAEPDGLTPYFSAMIKAYVEVTAFAKRTALTTIHPAALYGGLDTSGGFTSVIENMLNWRVWKLPVILPGQFPLVHAESLAKAIVLALEHEGSFIVSDGMCSLKQLAHTLHRQVRSYVPPEVPAGLAYAATAPIEAIGRALRIRPIFCKVQLDFITSGSEPLADHASQVLGWKPWSLEDGLRQYLADRAELLAARPA